MTTAMELPLEELGIGLFSPEGRADPYPIYARLRDEDPVHWSPGMSAWMVTRHADVSALIRDDRLAQEFDAAMDDTERTSAVGRMGTFDGIATEFMLLRDPPNHTRLRSLVNHGFTPRTVEGMRPRIRELVAGLVDALPDRTDLISGLAYPLPVMVISELLGIPHEDRGLFKGWSAALARALDGTTQEERKAGDEAVDALVEYLRPLIDKRRRAPSDDLISTLVTAEDSGTVSQDETISQLVLLFFAGHETTVNLIGNGMIALLLNREQLARLRDDPSSLIRTAVEEFLRYDSPVQLSIPRTVVGDIDIAGKTIRRGDGITLMLASANRDHAEFDRADELDVGRGQNRHMAFGGGIHFCVGAPLARIEAQEAITALLRRAPNLALDGEPERRDTFILRGLATLPVAL